MRFKIDWASLVVRRKFTVIALLYYVFEDNFQVHPPRACTWKIALRYKVKQRNNGKFPSNYKASPIDFETQISLQR